MKQENVQKNMFLYADEYCLMLLCLSKLLSNMSTHLVTLIYRQNLMNARAVVRTWILVCGVQAQWHTGSIRCTNKGFGVPINLLTFTIFKS